MIVPFGLTIAFALGVDPRRLVLLAVAIYVPVIAGILLGFHWLRARQDETHSPSLFCEGVASELRAGATLRDALATAATSVTPSSTSIGDSAETSIAGVAAKVAEQFPSIGEELRLTVIAAARSGSDAAALFDEIGTLAIAQSEIRHEVKVATAPGRATALVLLGAPVLYLVGQTGAGGLSRMLATSEQRVVVMIGLGMFLLGLGLACLVLWRSNR